MAKTLAEKRAEAGRKGGYMRGITLSKRKLSQQGKAAIKARWSKKRKA